MTTTREQGFGCMGFSAFYASSRNTAEESAKAVIDHVVKRGCTLLNTATFYGPLNDPGFGSNLRLLKKCLKDIDRSKVQLMVKICMDTRAPVEKTGTQWNLKADAKGIEDDVNYALETLGVDYIDIIVLCRVPKDISISESVLGMKAMVDAGKARHIGLSEASAATIRKAHSVYPIYCIEQEWSLWSRDIETDIVPTCKELGVKVVAYSPLGRGFFTGSIESRAASCLDEWDYRLISPKFQEENLRVNLPLLHKIQTIAAKKGCSVGQLSLAWLHCHDVEVIPIPGTTDIAHFDENYAALGITLSSDELSEINAVFTPDAVAGLRYPGNHNTFHEN